MKLTDLIILLHTKSVSYCYYKNNCDTENWICIDVLKEGIRFALKNNLHVQFVYPTQDMPENYKEIVNSINHSNIVPYNVKEEEVHIQKGEKIAQCIFQKYLTVDNDEATGERTGGFGSTSKN